MHKKLEFSLSSENEKVALAKLVKIIPERKPNINDSCDDSNDELKYTSNVDFPTDYKFAKDRSTIYKLKANVVWKSMH